ncbi:MAG: hypothetical protein BWY50_00972 [Spirochaetes bacterium ADurb.Bin315]|nr:hypothetical protein [Spirochaetota bacterium]OQA43358.1 MAG: hypothetical protein BWY50_00972 [Spirochaetes bacterium ADurb.Bin315]HOE89095.1 hypothetical protein [Sphaerochaeta sp.]HOR79802.1 hypothetical protein [Sphaerochaeta sp.]HPK63510.1 hypothetical protein [Sphaerochaeta sp.]
MSTLQSQIQRLSRAIEEHRRDLRTLYGDLGKATATDDSPSAQEVLQKKREYEIQEELYQQLTFSLKQFEDRSRKLKQVQKDLKVLSKEKKELCAQLGAIAYEAYGNASYSDELSKTLAPFLAVRKRRNAGAPVFAHLHRRALGRMFLKLGEEILTRHLEEELRSEAREELFKQVREYRSKEHLLGEELALHQSALDQLKNSEVPTPWLRLETYNQSRMKALKAYEEAAIAYGRQMYEHEGDQNPLATQITLHRTRIKQLGGEIKEKQNRIKIQELEAQIEIEKQKIEHIADQIGALRAQIDQLNSAIAKRRTLIRMLEGTGNDG